MDRITFAKAQRRKPTLAEKALWRELKKYGAGFRFTRQYPIGHWFADFCCRQRRVVVELDGSSHELRVEKDAMRDEAFRELGYVVLRFFNLEVLDDMPLCLERIRTTCESQPHYRY